MQMMMIQRFAVVVVLLGSSLTLANQRRHLQGSSIATIISNDPDLSILAEYLESIEASDELLDVLLGNEITLFAPTNAAFEAIQTSEVGMRVFTNAGFSAHLENLIAMHVTDMTLEASSVVMANGETVAVEAGGDSMTLIASSNVATATVVETTASNGVVYKLDAVLLPAFWNQNIIELARSNSLENLSTLTSFFDVVQGEALGGVIISTAETSLVTLFAPTNEAFEELGPGAVDFAKSNMNFLLNVLQNHLVAGTVLPFVSFEDGDEVSTFRGSYDVEVVDVLGQGESVIIGGSLILEHDILANNGIIHTIQNAILTADDLAQLNAALPPPTGAPVVVPTGSPVMAPVMMNVNTAAPIITNVKTAAPTMMNVNTAAPVITNVKTAAPTMMNVNTAAPSTMMNVNKAAPSTMNVTTAAPTMMNVTTAAPTMMNVTTAAPSMVPAMITAFPDIAPSEAADTVAPNIALVGGLVGAILILIIVAVLYLKSRNERNSGDNDGTPTAQGYMPSSHNLPVAQMLESTMNEAHVVAILEDARETPSEPKHVQNKAPGQALQNTSGPDFKDQARA